MVPGVEIIHDRLPVEIMRGCGHACRFCQATVIYKPARKRPVDDIVSQVTTNLQKSGYDEVTLLSLSSGDYPEIETLVRRLVDKLRDKHVAVSLPSLRISGLSLELGKMITENKRTGLTFAPEAGTERLRKVINKPVDEDTLTEVLTEAFKQGWQTIKLYFMIGLPTETEDDLQGIADLISKLNRVSEKHRGRRNFNITISPYSPKAHTPWQWERQISIEETYNKIDFLKRAVRKRNVHLKFHDPRTTWMEGVLGRGDRRIGDVILGAYRMGAHMDGWSENFDFEIWQKACREEGVDPERYLAERSTGDPLPWDHIEKGLSKESLLKELAKSRGLTDVVKSLDKEEKLEKETLRKKREDNDDKIMYGRAPKVQKAQTPTNVPQSRLRIKWGRSGLARFLSHLDNMKAIDRALRRANLPISFSQGFRPKPKISYGPPLSLGFTSEAEYFDIQLDVPVHDYMLGNLSREISPDFNLLGTKSLLGKAQSLSSQLNLAVYEVDLPLEVEDVKEKCSQILEASELHFQRETKSGPVDVEGRKAIIDLTCEETDSADTRLTMKTGMADLGFIKPLELLEQGFKLSPDLLPGLKIHRKAMYRMEDGNLIDPFDLL
jgi:radical SAM-linked protein